MDLAAMHQDERSVRALPSVVRRFAAVPALAKHWQLKRVSWSLSAFLNAARSASPTTGIDCQGRKRPLIERRIIQPVPKISVPEAIGSWLITVGWSAKTAYPSIHRRVSQTLTAPPSSPSLADQIYKEVTPRRQRPSFPRISHTHSFPLPHPRQCSSLRASSVQPSWPPPPHTSQPHPSPPTQVGLLVGFDCSGFLFLTAAPTRGTGCGMVGGWCHSHGW